jgi:diguanylate cyclase (GGDEF)-like protein
MPALDYVSIIRSVYGDRRAMLAGTVASTIMGALTAFKTQSLPLWGVTIAFIVIGMVRLADMNAFWKAAIGNDDAAAAERWEHRAIISGSLLAAVYGAWCFVAMVIVQDPFAELASASLSIAVMVGICGRNFGLDRLVTIQMICVIVPLSLGYGLHGDLYHLALAALLGIMLASFRKLAGDIRSILLSAVHGRVEASRLASQLDMAMTTLEHGLCMLDENAVIAVANERAVQQFRQMGITNLLGMPLEAVLTQMSEEGALPRTAAERLVDAVQKRSAGKVLLSLPEEHYYEVTVSSRGERTVLLFEDVSERIASEERISFMARYDSLTGLPNRNYFSQLVDDDLETRRLEAHERIVSLMIIDIDEFKHVNDTFGHIAGDQMLVQVANRLRAALPPEGIVARLGGDEFIVYRGAVGSECQAQDDAAKVLEAFKPVFELDGLNLAANVSIGLVTSTVREGDLDDLMTKADLALYSAKGNGRGRSQVFHEQMDIDYHYRQRLKTDLRLAVQQGALSLAFQPLLDIKTRRVVTCEALARWNHPELGAIPPALFIPLAEEMGIISDITAWVIEQAAYQCKSWPGQVGVAVNVSARDFRGADLIGLVERALSEARLPPERFEVEVTETAVIEERDIAKRVLTELASKGVAIALDDFGTGYSSLSYLSALPFTKLKIDRSFVADVTSNKRALRLLANVARLGRDLDLTVIAEGVETEEQLDAITGNTAVQEVQGYLFSRPLPAHDIGELISRFNVPVEVQTIHRLG